MFFFDFSLKCGFYGDKYDFYLFDNFFNNIFYSVFYSREYGYLCLFDALFENMVEFLLKKRINCFNKFIFELKKCYL